MVHLEAHLPEALTLILLMQEMRLHSNEDKEARLSCGVKAHTVVLDQGMNCLLQGAPVSGLFTGLVL